MSIFIRHEPCPSCGSKDNVSVWDDGHKFCHGCGWLEQSSGFEFKNIVAKLLALNKQQKESKADNASIPVPFDNTNALPKIALDWLKSYGLTTKEIHGGNAFSWSEFYHSLIYSCFDGAGERIFIQRRYFGESSGFPRFITKGSSEDLYHIIDPVDEETVDCIVVVEDIISCIKVGRHMPCLCLWGSNLSQRRIHNLSKDYPTMKIWLDKDKMSYSIMAAQRAKHFFESGAESIISDLDPKKYNDVELKKFLNLEQPNAI